VVATKSFTYEVIDTRGKRTRGKVEAANENAAAQLLRQQGTVPLSISSADSVLRKDLTIPGLSGRVTLRDLAIFARQFATLTGSGMTLLRSLSVLEEQTDKPRLQ
jgi:type IV pilus assembly protein PilC